ncbi:MAG: TonB family protein [Pseudomonadales bacterium]|nr:TonB family protein [Pseudomonadales bacterium]
MNPADPGQVVSLVQLGQLLALSLAAPLLAGRVFRSSPRSRRAFVLGVALILLILPVTWFGSELVIVVPMVEPLVWIPEITLPVWVPLALLGGGVLWALRVAAGMLIAQRRLLALPVCTDGRMNLALRAKASALALPEVPALRLSTDEGPAAGTLRRPFIVLPFGALSWDDRTLGAVLAHELVHVERRDDQWLLLARMVVALYWWLPWLRGLERHWREAMEESCDDRASQFSHDPLAYLRAVVRVAGERRTSGRPRAAVGMADRPGAHLAFRVRRFAGPRIAELDFNRVYWTVLLLLLLVTMVPAIRPGPIPERVPSRLDWIGLFEDEVTGRPPSVDVIIAAHGSDPSLAARFATPRRLEAPLYPGRALHRGVEGSVTVGFDLAADGTPVRLRVLSGGTAELERAALQAAARARFKPLHAVDARPTFARNERYMRNSPRGDGVLHFHFRLNDSPAAAIELQL